MVNIDNIADAEWRKPSNITQHKVMRDKINEVIGVVNEGSGGVATLKTDMATVQVELNAINDGVTNVQNEVDVINNDVTNVQNGLSTTNANLTALSGKIATPDELGLVKISEISNNSPGAIKLDAYGRMYALGVGGGGGGGTVPPELVQDVATLKTEMPIVQWDVSHLKTEVPLIQSDVYGLLSALNTTN